MAHTYQVDAAELVPPLADGVQFGVLTIGRHIDCGTDDVMN